MPQLHKHFNVSSDFMGAVNKEERKERIKDLRRQDDRNKRLPELLTTLAGIAGQEISEKDVLTLAEIDEHEINLNGCDFDFNYLNISFPRLKLRDLEAKVSVLSFELEQTNYLTFHHCSQIAVLKLNTAFVTNNIEKLIDFDKDSFYIHDLNYQNGLWVDFYREYWYLDGKAELTPILELRVFGMEWMKKVASAL